MVGTDPFEVDRLLAAGDLRCSECAGVLRPWGYARWRGVRLEDEVEMRRPRRSVCPGCTRSHVLLPALMLVRRADSAAVIGAGLVAKACGAGHRVIAVMLGRPEGTVRGWLRRFGVRALGWRVWFTELLQALDPMAGAVTPRVSVFADAVEVLGLAAAAAVRRVGPRPAWQFASASTGGLLLGPVATGAAEAVGCS